MDLVSVYHDDSVAILELNRGVTNPINLAMVDELDRILDDLREDPEIRAVVLGSSSDKFYSIGLDIPALFDLNVKEFTFFYNRTNQLLLDLFEFPKPVVAALSGHAIGGGCIMALCCDYRYIATGRKLMALNEIKIGVPVPYLADCILRQLVGVRSARQVMESGDFYPADELLQIGMVDRLLPLDELRPGAIAKARTLGAHPGEAYAMIKRSRTEEVAENYRARRDEKDRQFLKCWYSVEARALIEEAKSKF